jgi:hypothetical protein
MNPGMAVVVQVMVPAKQAGVLFTRHPFTGNPRQVVITANYGLGEVRKFNLFLNQQILFHLKMIHVRVFSECRVVHFGAGHDFGLTQLERQQRANRGNSNWVKERRHRAGHKYNAYANN